MSASHLPALEAAALQLAGALDRYEHDVAAMVDDWLDMETYGAVSDQVEEIRMYSASLPQVSVQWVELLIAHSELVNCMWRTQFREVTPDQIAQRRAEHADSVQAMRRLCLVLLAHDSAGPLGP